MKDALAHAKAALDALKAAYDAAPEAERPAIADAGAAAERAYYNLLWRAERMGIAA